MSKFILIFFILFLIFKSITLIEVDIHEPIVMNRISNRDKEVGKKGGVIFEIYDDKHFLGLIDTKRKVLFNKKILNENNQTFEVGCGPWFTNSSTFFIICEFNETIPKGNYIFQFKQSEDKFNYSKYEVQLDSSEKYTIQKLDSDKLDIYSDPQIINVTDDKENYEFKFNIKSYNGEQLFFIYLNNIHLDCNRKNDELICPIKKTFLECFCSKIDGREVFSKVPMVYYTKDGKAKDLELISEKIINFDIKKIDVYIKISKLLTKNIGISTYIAYETNVTNIQPVFNLVPINNIFEQTDFIDSCYFKKTEKSPLLILCQARKEGVISMKEIKDQIKLNEINHKYNFIILPVVNNETVTISRTLSYSVISGIYPTILDFSTKDTIQFDLFMDEPNKLDGISFNENAENLKCDNLENIKRCNISRDHFKDRNDEYYYLIYEIPFSKNKTISYINSPVTVILNKDNNKENNKEKDNDNKNKNWLVYIIIIALASIVIIIIILIIVCVCIKKTDKLKDEVLKTSFNDRETED